MALPPPSGGTMTTIHDGNSTNFNSIVWLIAGILFIIWLIIEIFQKLT